MIEDTIAIAGTRRKIQELVDGTLRVMIDIDPKFKKAFLENFPEIDMPCALVALNPEFEKWDQETRLQPEKPKGGPLCTLAARWCKDPAFQAWIGVDTEHEAANEIRNSCGIRSRSELDSNPNAAARFNLRFRNPFSDFLKNQLERE